MMDGCRAESFYTPDRMTMRSGFDIIQVDKRLWCIRYEARRSCAYILATSPGALVIDAGPDPTALGMMMGLQRARVGLSSIRTLVLTHSHPDQSGGARALSARSGISVHCTAEHARTLAVVAEPTWRERLRGASPLESFDAEGTLAAGQRLSGVDVVEGRAEARRPIGLYAADDELLFTGRDSYAAFEPRSTRWILPAIGQPFAPE